jgi:hypothetical protein
MSTHSPVDWNDPAQLAAAIAKIIRLDTLDRLKIWTASYQLPAMWIGYSLALDNGDPHPRFRACVHFNSN